MVIDHSVFMIGYSDSHPSLKAKKSKASTLLTSDFSFLKWRRGRDWRSIADAHRSRPGYRPSLKIAVAPREYAWAWRSFVRTEVLIPP
jgi:hypothetical protein